MDRNKAQALAEWVRQHHGVIALTSHEYPDGDALGSLLGLYLALKKLGKNVVAFLKGPIPYIYDFLPGLREVWTRPPLFSLDALFLLDATALDRTGFEEKALRAGRVIRIDHHLTGARYDPLDWVDPEAPSTGNLVLELVRTLLGDGGITPEIATNLYTAVMTDTGGFRRSNTTAEAFRSALYLAERGADPFHIAQMVFDRKKPSTFRLLALVLPTLEVVEEGRVAHITIRSRFFKEAGADPAEAEGFVNYPLSLMGVWVGIKFQEERENFWKLSFRGKGFVNLAEVAQALGGGGHFNASGCRMEGTEEEIKTRTLAVLHRYMPQGDHTPPTPARSGEIPSEKA